MTADSARRRSLPVIDHFCQTGKCGACCRHMAAPPIATDEDKARIPAELLAEIDAFVFSDDFDGDAGPCLWYDPASRRCKHYEHRPDVCRDFETGSLSCFVHRLNAAVADPLEAAATAVIAGMTEYRDQLPDPECPRK